MSTATLKRELALLRSSLAALKPAQSATLDDPIAWAERIAGLTLDPWQRDVLLSAAPRLLLNATRQSGKSTVAALKAAWTVLQGGLAVVVSPSLRQSGFLFRKLARHLVAAEAAFRRETLTEVELVSGGLAVSLPGSDGRSPLITAGCAAQAPQPLSAGSLLRLRRSRSSVDGRHRAAGGALRHRRYFALRVPQAAPAEEDITASALGGRRGIGRLLAIPLYRRIVLVAALVFGSHAMHDSFAVIRWREAGIGSEMMSVLWSESVAAEVISGFFVLGRRILDRIGPAPPPRCATAGLLRWI